MDKFLSVRAETGRHRRPNFPKDLKRRLTEQTFEAGASVALIARQNDINANLLFKWRQHYLNGDYGLPTVGTQTDAPAITSPFFLPAAIADDMPQSSEPARVALPASTFASGSAQSYA